MESYLVVKTYIKQRAALLASSTFSRQQFIQQWQMAGNSMLAENHIRIGRPGDDSVPARNSKFGSIFPMNVSQKFRNCMALTKTVFFSMQNRKQPGSRFAYPPVQWIKH